MPWAAKETVKRTSEQQRGGEAVLAVGEQADEQDRGRHQPDAAEGGRGDDPHRLLAVAGGELGVGAAVGEDLDPALGEPGGGADGVAEHRQSGKQKTGRAAARTSRSTYLGGDIKSAQSSGGIGRMSDYIRKGRTIGFLEPVREACYNLLLSSVDDSTSIVLELDRLELARSPD